MPKIISTATEDTDFTVYDNSQPGNPRIVKQIRINGGANVANPDTRLTLDCSETVVSEADFEILLGHPVFKRMVSRGYLKVVKEKDKEGSGGMEKKDGSAQLVEDDFIVSDEEDIDKIPEKEKRGKKHLVKVVKN